MSSYQMRETFFRPPPHARESGTLPALLYNELQLLLKRRSGKEHLFIPIRSMQFQAIVESEEVVFVDSHGGYAHRDGVGGRLIRIAWRPVPAAQRESLNGPVPCEIIYYFPALKETQRRLMSEFPPVLKRLLQLQRERDLQAATPRILPLRRNAPE